MRLCVAFFNGWWMNFVNIGRRANMWGWIYRQSFISCLLMAFLCIERTKYHSENGFLKVIIVCFYWEIELIELLFSDFVVIKRMDKHLEIILSNKNRHRLRDDRWQTDDRRQPDDWLRETGDLFFRILGAMKRREILKLVLCITHNCTYWNI